MSGRSSAAWRWLGRVARALGRVLVAVLVVAGLSWALVEAAPGSTVERAARAGGVLPGRTLHASPELEARILADVAARHQLEGSALGRVGQRVWGVARGDLGRSWRDGQAVSQGLGRALPDTLAVFSLALGVALVFGFGAAFAAVRAPRGWSDTALSVLAAVVFAMPPVWLAMLALRVLADGHPLRVLPAEGLSSAASLILPVACLAAVPCFVVARHARAALAEAMSQPFAVAARARGASTERVIAVHAARACVGQLAPLLPVVAAYLLGATMVLEEVFGIPGAGALLFSAAAHGDAPTIVGVAVFSAALVSSSAALADLLHHALDPRVGAPPGGG